MMLDPVHLSVEWVTRKIGRQQFRDASARLPVFEPVEDEREIRTGEQQIGQLAKEIGAIVLVDGHVLDVTQRHARFSQTIRDRLRWKAGPMLDAAEPLLLCRRNERA